MSDRQVCMDCGYQIDEDGCGCEEKPTPKPRRTRLVEAVEQGLSDEDRKTLGEILSSFETVATYQVFLGMSGRELEDWLIRACDFLTRISGMIEYRDRELADAEYEALCARLEADTCRQILADAIAQSNGSRDIQQSVTRCDGHDCQHSGTSDDETTSALRDIVARRDREIARLRGLLDGESHG